MRVVIHVGAHKTGTSLVQRYFNEDPQRTQALGIGFINRYDSSQLIGWGNKPPEGLRSRLEEETAKRPSIVLTSQENALGRPFLPGRPGVYPDAPQGAENLAKSCDGFDTHVVFYVRPIADFLESFYLQTIHQGASHTFQEWYDSLIGPHRWTPAVEALEHAFGADRVIIGDFTEIKAGQNQFLRQFMTRSGIPQPPTVEYERIENPSISARGLQIALGINPHLNTARERRVTRLFLQKHFSNQVEDRARPMPEELRRSVIDETAAEYEGLAARAAAGLATPPEPPPVPTSPPGVSPKAATTADRRGKTLRRRARRLVNRMRSRARH
jgi:hypothetical protein